RASCDLAKKHHSSYSCPYHLRLSTHSYARSHTCKSAHIYPSTHTHTRIHAYIHAYIHPNKKPYSRTQGTPQNISCPKISFECFQFTRDAPTALPLKSGEDH